MDFDVNVRERILKPIHEVFDAVCRPEKDVQLLHFRRQRAHQGGQGPVGVR
jgi:hypothetical protein